jgi:hypothetical protein
MKPPRQFRPLAPVALEDRIAPSQIAAIGSHAAGGHRVPPAQVQAATAGTKATFPRNIADTIAAGLPVYEQLTTRYNDRSVQTETRLIEPNSTNSSTLTTSTINLRHNGGAETVTDFSYIAVTGNTVRVLTTDLPDGTQQTENQTLQPEGKTTLIRGEIRLPGNGGVSSISGSTVDRGPITITDKTITDPAGKVSKEHIVTVNHGELRQTVTDTLTRPDHTRQVTRSTTTIVRLQPPASIGNGFLPSSTPVAGPKLG